MTRFTLPFDRLSLKDLPLVGGKNASLGELARSLPETGISVPDGFAITTAGFKHFLSQNRLVPQISGLIKQLKKQDLDTFAEIGQAIRNLVLEAALPDDLVVAISNSYRALANDKGEACAVAVRSSATAEDLPGLSFAGQHDSFLSVTGVESLLDAVKRCYASLYTDRALSYRIDHKIDHMTVSLSVGVQRMVASDEACSGVMFTLDPETGFRNCVLVSAAYGCGEAIVQGLVEPDEYYVHKGRLAAGYKAVFQHKLGRKHQKVVTGTDATMDTRTVPVPDSLQLRFCLQDDEIIALAETAVQIERHYSDHYGHATPMDIEWAKDAGDGRLYILQARPETVQALVDPAIIIRYRLTGKATTLASGRAIGKKIATGTARHVTDKNHLGAFQPGDILLAETTSPDWEPIMKQAAAIVTDHGGRTCHSAIVARELGIPAIVGTENGTATIRDGDIITVDCSAGETGRVLEGVVAFKTERKDIGETPRPHTKIMLNAADPEQAFQMGILPSDGVGLARIEFIITHAIGVHPMALLELDTLSDTHLKQQIKDRILPFTSGADFFVQMLTEGIAKIAAAFHPRPVIVRLSDFKSNEYAALLGGATYEQAEDNPMIGFRGAARYIHAAYAKAFALECAAVRRARSEMGFDNIRLMIPFCRTLGEADAVLSAMSTHGLKRDIDGLEVYIMCEIPSNVLSVAEFAERFDGFSIGSNDLTQLTLGIDRDSALLAETFDERDPAVKRAITMAVEGAHLSGVPIGICGQAPSDYPDFAEFLVEIGIDSMSVTSDVFFDIFETVAATERALQKTALMEDMVQ
ncbi:phosphoenolpyruvate synthase [Kordiimonas lipolytica]|uniref:Phosphoenolpyruvate synthase n=1 Tax=Kordiimonas lipolytica TaxID=1662421 RepID=A0ABV8U6M9_9PROT|nr:phosphoenolpyruvate synthase [Kordiimonas lipolytica]